MGLGLRREKFGDLLVTATGFALFVEDDVADYLLQHELRIKHVPMAVKEQDLKPFNRRSRL